MASISIRWLACACAAAAAPLLVAPAHAQDAAWPDKPITLMVGYPPGGSTDLVARVVSAPLSKRLGQPIIVENVGGAGGTIAAQKVVSSRPDGYTLLLGSGSEVTIARLFNTSVRYDGATDLSHIGLIGITPMVFVASPSAHVKTLDEAIARARKEPDRLGFASAGIGTPLHIAGELINMKAGTTFRHIPYRGAGAMAQDVIAGTVDFGVFVLASALPHIENGRMIALGVTTPTRSPAAPDIPALAENPTLKGYDMNVWFGLFGPARLPQPMIARLNRELNEVLQEKDVRDKLAKAGISTEGGTPQKLTAFIQAETQRVRSVVTTAIAKGARP